jgi:phosphatidylglycerophosphatase A
VIRSLAVALATGGHTGWFPVAPGTVGSAVGVGLWWGLRAAGAGVAAEFAVVAALFVAGAWAAAETERALGITDPGPVVIDEVMGMCVTLIGAPLSWPAAIAGFALFRLFDIVKPPPARRLERLHGGWGIMADDLAAGVYAWAALQLALTVAPTWLR